MQVRIIPGTQLFPWMFAAFCLDGGALPVRSKNERLRMGEQEIVDTNQRWYHLEKWSWRRLQDADKMRAGKIGQCLGHSGLGRPYGQIE